MSENNVFPKSVQPGIPKLEKCPKGWLTVKLGNVLKKVERPVKLDDSQTYCLVTAKRSRAGIVKRSELLGRDIKVKTQFEIKAFDFLVSRRQIVHGGCGVVPKDLDGSIVSNEYLVLHSTNELYHDYLKWLSHSIYFQQTCFHSSIGVHVEKMVFKPDWWFKFKFHLPPIEEQKKITSILDLWNTQIERFERLIVLKEKYKSYLLNNLMSGAIRLEGFSSKWKSNKLDELFIERKETHYEKLPLLSITKDEGVINRNEIDRKDNSNEDKTKYLRICPGDIGYNTMRMWQGVSAYSSLEGIVSPAYTICIPNKSVDGKFMSYLFKVPKIIHLFYRYSQGLTSDTWNLKYHNFSQIRVRIPDKDEQIVITSILDSIEKELILLKKQYAMLKEQHKGLINNLVSGKWRVKVED